MQPETGAETIERVLSAFEIGAKLRRLRLRKKLALSELAKHTGLSASLLSQLENGKMIPTLPTLARVGLVFDVGLDHFFGDKRERKLFSIIRADERMRFPERADNPEPAYFFECLAFSTQGKGLQAYLAEFPPRPASHTGDHFHEGAEFIYVLEGDLIIRFQGQSHTLHAGDSLHMDSSEPHSYRGTGKAGARAVVITVPPRI